MRQTLPCPEDAEGGGQTEMRIAYRFYAPVGFRGGRVSPSWPLGPGNNVAEVAHPPPRKVPGDFYGCLILSDFAAIHGCGIPRNPGWVKKTGTVSNLVGSGLTGA